MRRLTLLAAIALLMSAAPVYAQAANPCDAPASGTTTFTGTVNQSVTLSVCELPKATDGTPITAVQGWTIYLDGVSTALSLTAGQTSTVTGLVNWTGAYVLPATPGAHTVQVTVTGQTAGGTMKESAKSNPLALTVSPSQAPPAAPVSLTAR